jgi:hypothetical protein
LHSAIAVGLSRGLSTLLVLLLVELDGSCSVLHGVGHGDGLVSFTLEGGLRHHEESLFNLGAFESTGFVEHHIVVIFSPLLSLVGRNLSMLLLIQFISEADKGEIVRIARASIFDESLLPFIETVETVKVGKVVAQRAAVSSTVESVSERLELLLASGIPDLESDDSVINKDFFLGEISTDSRLRLSLHFTVEILLQKSGLSNTGVTQNDNLKEVLLLGHLVQTNTVKRLNTRF